MSTHIYFQPTEVPIGARVLFCIPGNDEPASDILPLTCLFGGVPQRPKLYDCNGDNPAIFGECAAFVEGVRFVPAEIYTVETAPEETKFIVHSKGDWLNYEAYPSEWMIVTKLGDGTLMSVCGFAYNYWLRRIELPADARLIPIGKCKYTRSVDDAMLLFLSSRSRERVALETAGCTFRHEPFGNYTDQKDAFHVWLPDGWCLERTDRRFNGDDGREYEIRDTDGNVYAYAIFFTWNKQRYGGVRIRENAST